MPPRAEAWRRSRPTSAATRKSRAGGRPSLLQDVIRKRRTEIEYLNGYVVDEGRKAGVATPFNQAIVELYRRYGVGELTPDPKNLEPMLKLLPR